MQHQWESVHVHLTDGEEKSAETWTPCLHVHVGPMLCSDDGAMQAFWFLKLEDCKWIPPRPWVWAKSQGEKWSQTLCLSPRSFLSASLSAVSIADKWREKGGVRCRSAWITPFLREKDSRGVSWLDLVICTVGGGVDPPEETCFSSKCSCCLECVWLGATARCVCQMWKGNSGKRSGRHFPDIFMFMSENSFCRSFHHLI